MVGAARTGERAGWLPAPSGIRGSLSGSRVSQPRVALVGLVLTLLGCEPEQPVPQVDLTAPLPSVAAEFRSSVVQDGTATEIEWRLWRDAHLVVVENLSERRALYWQRDGNVVFHRVLFHDDRRGVEFQPGDLDLIEAPTAWSERALLFPPQLLTELRIARSGWRDGSPYRRYEGDLAGSTWRITLAVDSLLPLEIDRLTAGRHERTTLVAHAPLAAAPWTPVAAQDYELIDFADFGDRESDPFVARVQSQLNLGHAHAEGHR